MSRIVFHFELQVFIRYSYCLKDQDASKLWHLNSDNNWHRLRIKGSSVDNAVLMQIAESVAPLIAFRLTSRCFISARHLAFHCCSSLVVVVS